MPLLFVDHPSGQLLADPLDCVPEPLLLSVRQRRPYCFGCDLLRFLVPVLPVLILHYPESPLSPYTLGAIVGHSDNLTSYPGRTLTWLGWSPLRGHQYALTALP
jgi:hypothetical protein